LGEFSQSLSGNKDHEDEDDLKVIRWQQDQLRQYFHDYLERSRVAGEKGRT
jgi:hypothetical protein